MKKSILVLVLITLSLLLQGCYLETTSNYAYYKDREEEQVRVDIYEQYYDLGIVYFDPSIHDLSTIDWIDFLKQDSHFKLFTEQFSDYMFLIEVTADDFSCTNNFISLTYSDTSHGFYNQITVECIDMRSNYQNVYEKDATISINNIDALIQTKNNNMVEITYGGSTSVKEIHSIGTFVFGDEVIAVKRAPLGYEIIVANDVYYIYDNNVLSN